MSSRVAHLVLVLALALAAILPACDRDRDRDRDRPSSDAAVFKAATQALDKRLAAIRDYTFEGTARQIGDGNASMPITYAFLQPQFARGTIGTADKGQTVVFDGTAILALDHAARTFARVDNSIDPDLFLLNLHQAFSEFACEGWRPPLIKPQGTTAAASDGKWLLTIAIDDDTLKEEQLVLRAQDGGFVEKKTFDKAGNVVASTRVLEELDDPATGLKLPKKWQRTMGGQTFEVELSTATVNRGIRREDFSTAVPEGYKQGP